MTNEEKSLLLQDLCARLPYGVVVQIISKHPVILGDGNESDESDEPYNVSLTIGDHDSLVDFFNGDWVTGIKPYLRPMESMTIAERNELADIPNITIYENGETISNGRDIDWMNKRHLDYRELIPMGLALPALEGMYD